MVFKYNFPLRFASAQWDGIQSLSFLQGGISCKVLVFNSRQLADHIIIFASFSSNFSSCCAFLQMTFIVFRRWKMHFLRIFRSFFDRKTFWEFYLWVGEAQLIKIRRNLFRQNIKSMNKLSTFSKVCILCNKISNANYYRGFHRLKFEFT